MPQPNTPHTPGSTATGWSLGLILCIGALARLYHLDVPSLWADEIQATFGASFPLPYLFRWIMTIEVHPPTYHLLLKLFLLFGDADAIVRLPSAMAGIASIYLVYKIVRESFTANEGLFAAALLASNPLHIWISRQVRPYAVLVALLCLSYLYLRRYFANPTRRTLAHFCLANAPLVLLHLVSILILGAQTAVFASAAVSRRISWKQAALFLGASGLTFVPLVPVFVKTLLDRPDVSDPLPYGEVLAKTLENLAGLFDFFHTGWLLALLVGLLGLGLFRLARTRLRELVYPLAFVLVPLAAIMAKRYASYYFPTHVSFMLPVLLLPASLGATFLCLGKRGLCLAAAPALAAALTLATCVQQADKLYRTESNIITWWDFGTFKTMGREFASRFHAKDLIVVEDPFIADAANWYYRRFVADNILENQTVGPQDATADVTFLSLRPGFGDLWPAVARLRDQGCAATPFRLDTLHGLTFSLARTPGTSLRALPFEATFTAAPDDVYVRARSLSHLAIQSSGGFALSPTGYDTPGIVEYEVRNDAGLLPGNLAIGLAYDNPGEGNTIALEYAYDDGPYQRATVSETANAAKFSLIQLDVPQPFLRLRLRAQLVCRQRTPYAVSGNRHGLRLSELFVSLYDEHTKGPAANAITAWLKGRLLESYQGTGFLRSGPKQSYVVDQPENVRFLREHDEAVTLAQASPDRPVTVTATLPAPGGRLVFYPRVADDGRVTVTQLDAQGNGREIFSLQGLTGKWSPVAARYAINVGQSAATLQIRLTGGAQLWQVGDKLLFTP